MTFFARAYGLSLESNQPISGLPASSRGLAPDLRVCLGAMPGWRDGVSPRGELWHSSSSRDHAGAPVLEIWKLDGGAHYRLRYSDGTEFVVDEKGRELWAVWPEGLNAEYVMPYLLGQVMGFVLLLRGVPALHASAIAVDGQAVAILGPQESGKSTTAALLARAGYRVLADDLAALDEGARGFFVRPGHPRLKLWSDSVHALFGRGDALPQVPMGWDKRYLDLAEEGSRFQEEPLRLAAIYVLGDRLDHPSRPLVAALSPNAATMALVANAYASVWLDRTLRAQQFAWLRRLAAHVPVREVRPHQDIAYLQRLGDVILEDFRARRRADLGTPAVQPGA